MSIRSISLLGQPEASFEGRPVRFRIKKALALLCYLAAEGGSHPRRELAELLWPQSDERHARTDLRSALAKLRKTLGEDGALGDAHEESVRFLVVDGDLLGVEPRGIELDLRTLESAVELARSEASGTSTGGSRIDGAVGRRDLIARLEETLGVYRGEFMEGFSLEDAPEFELWLEGERERWRGIFGELCQRLSSLQVEGGETPTAVDTLRLWTRHAPLEELAHRRLVELLSAAGDSTGALLTYEDFRSTLRRRLGLEPSPQIRELAERLREEVEERASLSVARSEKTPNPLLALEVPFAGRREEFGALVSEYQTVCAGDRIGKTRVVAVLGEAGIGKTRLANEFLGWARARGADVLKGGASEGAGLPYGPLVEAIRPRIERERAPDDLLEDAWLSELSRLLPELKDRYPDLPSPTSGGGETAKGALFEAIARTVGALASRAPVVLFLDDLQWADATTLEVLDHAGSRWAEQGASVLVLVAARPEEPEGGAGLERWFSSLGRRLPVRSLVLGPLANEDVGGLLRRLARAEAMSPAWAPGQPGGSSAARTEPERFVARLLAETSGQPFYLVETLKALLEDGKLVMRSRADGETVVEVGPDWREGSTLSGLLPQSVREVINARLSRLTATASELLRAGAVLERGFGFESVVRMVGLREAEGLRGLEELIERRLLLEEADGRGEGEEPLLYADTTYSFSHEKIRQVAYTEGGRARRRMLHRRAFEVLEEENAPAAQLARHAMAGGLAEQAFGYSVAAGDQAMEVLAVRDATAHYERARDLLSEEVRSGGAWQLVEPSISDLEHLYTQLGRAYELTYEWGKAREAYETMLALGRRLGEARLEVVALNQLAVLRFPYQKVDLRKAQALLEEARRVAEEAGLTEALAETECNLADLMSFRAGEPEHSRPPAEKALTSARALVERPDLIARTLWTLARVEMDAGRFEESAAYAEESAALSRKLAERPAPRTLLPSMLAAGRGLVVSWRAGTKAMEIRCLGVLAFDRIWQGRLQEGIRIAREAHGVSRELPEQAEAMGSWALGPGLVEVGEYEEGLELCRRGTEMARKLPNVFLLWYNLDNLGRAYEALLDLEEARRVYEEALELSGLLGPRYEKFSSIKHCAVAALSENWVEAYAHALRAREVATSFLRLDIFYLHYQVEALLLGGDERLARESVRRFAERVEVNERERVAYLRSLAVLGEFEGDRERAIDYLHEAQMLVQRIGLPGELWQIRSRIGGLHERGGEAEQARAAFSMAAQTLRTLAQKIGDEGLRERFLSAPQARRVLGWR